MPGVCCCSAGDPDNQTNYQIMLTIETKKVFVYGGQKYDTAAACLKAIIQDMGTADDVTFTAALIKAANKLQEEMIENPPVIAPKKRGRKPTAVVEPAPEAAAIETKKQELKPATVVEGAPTPGVIVKRRGRPAKDVVASAEPKRRGRPVKEDLAAALPPVPPPVFPGLPPLPPGA